MGGDSLYYGLNATSNNLIMVDRKKVKKSKWTDPWNTRIRKILCGKKGNDECIFYDQ